MKTWCKIKILVFLLIVALLGSLLTACSTPNLHYQRISGKEEYRLIGIGLASEVDIVIPDTYNGLPVTEIGARAFYECVYIESVKIPNSVTSIGDRAFYNCSSLTSVVIGDSVTSIGHQVFCGCSSLTSVVIPNSVTSISSEAFSSCDSLTSIEIPDSVTSIGSYGSEVAVV